jgi:hypothetical protein
MLIGNSPLRNHQERRLHRNNSAGVGLKFSRNTEINRRGSIATNANAPQIVVDAVCLPKSTEGAK